jgi:hypothetical protein
MTHRHRSPEVPRTGPPHVLAVLAGGGIASPTRRCGSSPRRRSAGDSTLRPMFSRRCAQGGGPGVNEARQPKIHAHTRAVAVLLVCALLLPACSIDAPAPPTIVVTQTQVIQAPQGGAGTGATPTPTLPGGVRIASVRVGIFAQSCPGGGGVPNNAQNTIRLDCIATFTATPRDSEGRELLLPDASWQAMSVRWEIAGGACVDLDAAGGNAHNVFNRQVRGDAEGTCSVCATVDGVAGCALQPNGDRLVRVIA